MNKLILLSIWAAALSSPLYAQEKYDSIQLTWEKKIELNEVVVVAQRPVLRQATDRIVYLTKNDPYATGLNGIELLGRIPRVSVVNDLVSVAGKTSVRYIVDGHLLEMSNEAIGFTTQKSSGIRYRKNRTAYKSSGKICHHYQRRIYQYHDSE